MAVPQQKFREIVFQMLYSSDLGRASEEDMLPLLMEELSVPKQAVKIAQERVRNIFDKQKEIDKTIAKISTSYEFDRIQSVERNVLRLGVFELLYDDSIPPKVAIAEALRLARKFGSPESAAFVNAVLDHIYKASQGIKLDDSQVSQSMDRLIQSEEEAQQVIGKHPKKSDEEDEEEVE